MWVGMMEMGYCLRWGRVGGNGLEEGLVVEVGVVERELFVEVVFDGDDGG